MMKRVFRISSLLAVLLLMSSEVMAAGLGKLSVSSALGQPLQAEIELLAVQSEDIATVEAKLASADAYRQAHVDRSSVLSGLNFSIGKRANGQPVVRITSAAPINDPFVDLLVELNWSSGRILREYTVLLDTATNPVAEAEQEVLAKVAPTVSGSAAPVPALPATATEKQGAKGASQERRTYGPVKSGETLQGIAGKLLPANVSLDMMMASLYHANQGAFAQKNMNLLKKGQVLSVPDRDTVMRLYSPNQAKQLIQEQSSAWHSMQNRLADQAMRSPAAQVKEQSAESGKVAPAQTAEKPPAPPVTKDVLKLSKGQPANASADPRLHDLETEVTAKNRELQDAQDRIRQLEKTVQDLMQLKSQQGGQKAEPVAGQPTAAAPEAKPMPRPHVAPPAVPEEPGFLSVLLASPLYIAGGLAALLLAGLFWLFTVSNRRRKGLSNFEQSIMTGGDQFKTSIFKTTSGAKTEHGAATQSGATTDFSRLGLGSIDSHEVDPIAEAEVYMAYGRDAQAEEILKDALAKEPRRHEIALKLLEIYAARQDKASFETQASELYADLGDPANDMWQKAAEMGRTIDPDNPLYRMFGEAPSRSIETDRDQTDATTERLVEAPAVERQPEIASTLGAAVESASEAHETGLDSSAQVEPTTNVMGQAEPLVKLAADDMTLDFEPEPSADALAFRPDRNEFDPAVAAFPSFGTEVTAAVSGTAENSIPAATETESPVEHNEELSDLDLMPESLDITTSVAPVVPEPAGGPLKQDMAVKLPDLDFSGLDLELAETPELPTETAVAQPVAEIAAPVAADSNLFEEASTKLDLAKAYLEMGDKEGAREILSEVLKEGDSQQQEAARALMAEIG